MKYAALALCTLHTGFYLAPLLFPERFSFSADRVDWAIALAWLAIAMILKDRENK